MSLPAAAVPSTDPRATAFVAARRGARALVDYPGALPASLAEAYALQDQAIGLWGDVLVGWKVGRINAPWCDTFGTDRLAGPVFRQGLRSDGNGSAMPVFSGGFGAVEGEVVLVLGSPATPRRTGWTREQAGALVSGAHVGIEVASSPLASINELGPLVTISDFGNNNGLVLGSPLPLGIAMAGQCLFETRIDGLLVGSAVAAGIPGGPLESVRALLDICSSRGITLPAGTLVSTGAVTGVHAVSAGQSAVVTVESFGSVECTLVSAVRTDEVTANRT
jgi:2-keto-4-pentenoate hydratase